MAKRRKDLTSCFDDRKFTEKNMYKCLLFCAALLLLTSCERESNTYEVGNSLVTAQTKVALIDTLTLKMSTVMMDSVTTSGKSKLLVGDISDPTFGNVRSSSLFELSPSSYSLATNTNVVFDSLVMYLTNTDFYYGDTLKTFQLDVHPMEDRIKLNSNGYLYNKSFRKYASNSIGTATFFPRPQTDSSFVKIKLDQTYGQNLFNLIKSKDIDSQEYFLNFYKGLALVPSSNNNAMLRFGINSSYQTLINKTTKERASNVVRMYYHSTSINGTEDEKYTLDLNPSSNYQYNQIKSNFAGSDLAGLSPTHPLQSANLGNKSFLMGGIGVYTKVEIPYLKNIKDLYPHYTIVSADLFLSPAQGYYSSNFYNPSSLYYYYANKNNQIVSSFLDTDGSTELTSTLTDNSEFQSNYGYNFSILNHVTSILTEPTNSNYNILVYPSSSSDVMSSKAVFGDQKNSANAAKLHLYILGY